MSITTSNPCNCNYCQLSPSHTPIQAVPGGGGGAMSMYYPHNNGTYTHANDSMLTGEVIDRLRRIEIMIETLLEEKIAMNKLKK